MIIARSPENSLGGGAQTYSYYQDHEGFWLLPAISKYVYVTTIRPFTPGIFLKYSRQEQTELVAEIQHPIIREALWLLQLKTPQIELTTWQIFPLGPAWAHLEVSQPLS